VKKKHISTQSRESMVVRPRRKANLLSPWLLSRQNTGWSSLKQANDFTHVSNAMEMWTCKKPVGIQGGVSKMKASIMPKNTAANSMTTKKSIRMSCRRHHCKALLCMTTFRWRHMPGCFRARLRGPPAFDSTESIVSSSASSELEVPLSSSSPPSSSSSSLSC